MNNEDIRWINKIIRGIVTFRKCPSCDNEGVELVGYNEDGEPAKGDEEFVRYRCEDCEGLGFIELP